MGEGLEAGGEGPRRGEPGAGAEVVLESELHGVGLGGTRRRRGIVGSAAGGDRRRGLGRGAGGGSDSLELVVVVEEDLVGLEGGGEGEGGDEEEEQKATRRGHCFAAEEILWSLDLARDRDGWGVLCFFLSIHRTHTWIHL